MGLAPAPDIADMTPSQPHGVTNAASGLGKSFELGIHNLALLGAHDGGTQRSCCATRQGTNLTLIKPLQNTRPGLL